jgi:CubicO group peptidase (beta-lactamase class C family)
MPGTIMVVAHGADIVYECVPPDMTLQTCFRLASVSKQFTAFSLLLLVQDGHVALDDLLTSYIPDLPVQLGCTLRHVLEHTSDIRDGYDLVDQSIVYDNAQLKPLVGLNGHAPGTLYEYNNMAYDMIPLVVEHVAGVTFTQFLRERIFEPLGMTRTFTALELDNIDDVVSGYYASTGKTYAFYHTDHVLGSGSIFSCAKDLLTWNLGLSTLGSSELLDLAWSEITPHYGLGFEVYADHVAHSGYWQGFNTYLAFYPQDNKSVVVLSNWDDTDAQAIGRALARINQTLGPTA